MGGLVALVDFLTWGSDETRTCSVVVGGEDDIKEQMEVKNKKICLRYDQWMTREHP